MPLISVIVPVYKVEAYLPRCIDSILTQTFTDLELILVDDGSPDNCGAICDAYAEKDSRIIVVHQKNAKLSAARNAGMDLARGHWIALMDSDDWLHRDYLKILLSGAQDDTDIVICGCVVTDRNQEQDTQYSDVRFESASLKEISADHIARSRAWGRILRKSAIGDLRYISGTEPVEDICFNELLFRDDMKYRITQTPLYYYYMRPDSAVHSHLGRGMLNAVGVILEQLEAIDDDKKRKRMILRCYKSIFSARYGEMFTDDCADVKKRCSALFKQLSAYRSELDAKDRIVIRLLCASPLMYRLYRISDDRTLLQYENEQRKLRRQRRNQVSVRSAD